MIFPVFRPAHAGGAVERSLKAPPVTNANAAISRVNLLPATLIRMVEIPRPT
jgi:hypothetical protein